MGNIRASKVDVNYTGYQHVSHEDYFVYDASNRMIVNKGKLQNGEIVMTTSQGSTLRYDATGNISGADKYEGGNLVRYDYRYNTGNQLEVIRKNGLDLQAKQYDKAGNVTQENLYNTLGALTQRNTMLYEQGQLMGQVTTDGRGVESSRTYYAYDAAGNLVRLTTQAPSYKQTHEYTYDLWESYQQKEDRATLEVSGRATVRGQSERFYDVNGQLKQVIDRNSEVNGANNTTEYYASSLDGIRAKKDRTGETSYLTVAGKTLGDLRLDANKTQHLEVYGGFTPMGSAGTPGVIKGYLKRNPKLDAKKQAEFFNSEQGQAMQKAEAGILPDAPQDNLGAYTLQAGDTLESIALQVYGDGSLWYLIADANGITDRHARAGEKGSALHLGQRLNIPPAATGAHHTSTTRKVITSRDWLGNTSATLPMPPAPAQPRMKQHASLFKKIVTGVVMVVATVMTAGALGLLASGGLSALGAAGLKGLMAAGSNLLAGGASTAASLGIGFSAGFVGNLAAQGAACALNAQHGVDLTGALISGLATAATAGLSRALKGNPLTEALRKSPVQSFNLESATTMMENDALNQGIHMALGGQQRFDWQELGIQGAAAGLMGGTHGQAVNETLNQIDHGTGLLSSELQSVVTGSATSAASGARFDAAEVLTHNLGSTLGNLLVKHGANDDRAAWKEEEERYCPIPISSTGDEGAWKEEVDDILRMNPSEKSVFWGAKYGLNPNLMLSPNILTPLFETLQSPINLDVVTAKQLRKMFPYAEQKVLDAYLPELNAQLGVAGINTPRQLAYFFATVYEETGGMRKLVENDFTYTPIGRARDVFTTNMGKMSDAEIKALGCGKRFANIAYAGINGNGDVSSGDGYVYRGRGLFHHTGRGNYRRVGGADFVDNPDLVLISSRDVSAAVNFWNQRDLKRKSEALPLHVVVPRNKKEKVTDPSFIAAVKPVNKGLVNINNRAASYNCYIDIFQQLHK